MDSTHLISATWIILFIVFDIVKDVNSTCPLIFPIEKGHNATVGCNVTGNPSSTFWYIGSPSHTSPILSLSNNQKSGTMYGNSRFDINNSGDMLIFNAQVQDEATYTVVYFISEENHQQRNITVEIRVHPKQQCPKIAECTSCTNCSLKINQTGELICSVSGTRPKLSLQWDISHIDNLQFTSHESQSEEDDVSGTWDSEISASYSFSQCGAFADIRCLATDNPNLIEQSFSDITLSADPCPTGKPADGPPVTKMYLYKVVIIPVVVCLALILCLILVVRTIKQKKKKHGIPEILNSDDKKLQSLLHFLCESYKRHCKITLFAGEEVKKVDIDALFIDCQCLVKRKNGSNQMMTTDEVMTRKVVESEKSVKLTGDIGLGKTTFFGQMINKWIQEEKKTYLLLCIQLNESNYHKNLIEIVMDEGPPISREDIQKILCNNPVVVLIDGLSELSLPEADIFTHYNEALDRIFTLNMQTTRKSKKKRNQNTRCDPTQEELQPINEMHDMRTRNEKMRTWIALRQENISFPPKDVTIELVGFKEEQINELQTKMREYRQQCKTTDQTTTQDASTKNGRESVIDKTLANIRAYEQETAEDLLRYNHFAKYFPKAPLFLTNLLYNIVCGGRERDTDLTRAMVKIVKLMIDCMERHYNTKRRDSVEETTDSTLAQRIYDEFLIICNTNITKSVTDWEQIFAKDKLPKVFSIGFLQKVSKDDSQSVTFRYPFVEGLCREYHLLLKFSRGKVSLENDRFQSEYFRLALIYICTLEKVKAKIQVLKKLSEEGMWDDFIDCYSRIPFETGKTLIESFTPTEEILVTNLHEIYHRENVEKFLSECKTLNYPRGTFVFEGQFIVSYLTNLVFPNFERIVLSNGIIDERDISLIVEWMFNSNITPSKENEKRIFQFHNCAIDAFNETGLARLAHSVKWQSDLPVIYISISSGDSLKNCAIEKKLHYESAMEEFKSQIISLSQMCRGSKNLEDESRAMSNI